MRHLFPDKEVIGSAGPLPGRLYRGRANIVNALWFTSAKARKTARPDEGRQRPSGGGATLAGPPGDSPRPLARINKCCVMIKIHTALNFLFFSPPPLGYLFGPRHNKGSAGSSPECLTTGAAAGRGERGSRLDIKTPAFWKSDTLLTRVLLSQRRDLVSADCSLVLGSRFPTRAPVTGAH